MKPEALTFSIFIVIACCTQQFATANNTQQHINDLPQSSITCDTLQTSPSDSLLHLNDAPDSLITGKSTESKDTSKFSTYQVTKQFVKDFAYTTAGVATYPFTQWETRDYVKSAILLGASGFTYAVLDDPIKEWAQRTRNSHSAFFSDKLQFVGQGDLSGGVVAAFEIYGLAAKQKKPRRVALLSAESFVISTGICTIMKHLAGRARPNTGADHDQWYGPQVSHKSQTSFFSGHTTAIFSVATVVAIEYSNHKWAPPAIYTLATLAAASRIHDNKHWTSDVLFAALLSHYVAKTVVRMHNKMGNKFYLAPEISGNYNGLALHYCF